MASSVVLKRAANASIMKKLFDGGASTTAALRPFAAAGRRSFNTSADQMTNYDDGGRDVDARRRPDSAVYGRRDMFPSLFSDVFDPFSTRSVGQLLNMVDQLADPFFGGRGTSPAAVSRRGWDVKEDESSLSLKMDMPGVDKENVKVTVDNNNTLVIKGEAAVENEEEESRRRYSSRIQLEPGLYKVDGIKAEMKNGVLKVSVPKVQEEERNDVQEITVE